MRLSPVIMRCKLIHKCLLATFMIASELHCRFIYHFLFFLTDKKQNEIIFNFDTGSAITDTTLGYEIELSDEIGITGKFIEL